MGSPSWSRSSSVRKRCGWPDHVQVAGPQTAGGCRPPGSVGVRRSPAAWGAQAVPPSRRSGHDRAIPQRSRHLPGAPAENRPRHRDVGRRGRRRGRVNRGLAGTTRLEKPRGGRDNKLSRSRSDKKSAEPGDRDAHRPARLVMPGRTPRPIRGPPDESGPHRVLVHGGQLLLDLPSREQM